MDENKQHFWHIFKILTKVKEIYFAYGEGTVDVWMYLGCFAKICTWDFSLNDAPWLSRLVEIDNNWIKILVENNQCF